MEPRPSSRFRPAAIAAGRGFTLIELLVVIAILAILLAILVPLTRNTIYSAKDAQCRSNMRSLAMGLSAYVADYGHYPMCHQHEQGTVIGSWVTQIRRYTGGLEMFNDPVAPPETYWRRQFGPPGGIYATQGLVDKYGYELGERILSVFQVPFSYGYNDWGAERNRPPDKNGQQGLGSDGWDYPYVKIGMVKNPAKQVAISCTAEPDGSWDFNIDPRNPREYPGPYHKGGCNIVYADGHVGWMLRSRFINVGNSPEGQEMRRLWNKDYSLGIP